MPMCKGKDQSNSILYPLPADRDLLYTVYCILGAGGDQVCCLHVPGAVCCCWLVWWYADLWRLWQCCDPWPRSRLAAVITNYNIIIMTRLNQATNPTWAGLGCGGLGWAGLRWAGHNYYFQVSWNSSRDCGAISRAGHMAPVRAQTRHARIFVSSGL